MTIRRTSGNDSDLLAAGFDRAISCRGYESSQTLYRRRLGGSFLALTCPKRDMPAILVRAHAIIPHGGKPGGWERPRWVKELGGRARMVRWATFIEPEIL